MKIDNTTRDTTREVVWVVDNAIRGVMTVSSETNWTTRQATWTVTSSQMRRVLVDATTDAIRESLKELL